MDKNNMQNSNSEKAKIFGMIIVLIGLLVGLFFAGKMIFSHFFGTEQNASKNENNKNSVVANSSSNNKTNTNNLNQIVNNNSNSNASTSNGNSNSNNIYDIVEEASDYAAQKSQSAKKQFDIDAVKDVILVRAQNKQIEALERGIQDVNLANTICDEYKNGEVMYSLFIKSEGNSIIIYSSEDKNEIVDKATVDSNGKITWEEALQTIGN